MTNYNDGKWHGWNGGECPVHPETVVEVVYLYDDGGCNSVGVSKKWYWGTEAMPIIAFRVIKEHKEPREFWLCDRNAYKTRDMAKRFAYGASEIIHVKEVMEMTNDIGTLQEIGVKVGDVVELVSWPDYGRGCSDSYKGTEWTIIQRHPKGYCGPCLQTIHDGNVVHMTLSSPALFRIISRADQGPVREVTRKEIVPGVYGSVKVHDPGLKYVRINVDAAIDMDELTAAIDTITAIRDAIADSSGDVSIVQAR